MTTDNKGAMTGEHCINCGLKVDPKCACSRGRALLVAQPAHDWRNMLAVLIDVYDDGQNGAWKEHLDEAWKTALDEARAALSGIAPVPAESAMLSDGHINRIADGLFDHLRISDKTPPLEQPEFREVIASAIAQHVDSLDGQLPYFIGRIKTHPNDQMVALVTENIRDRLKKIRDLSSGAASEPIPVPADDAWWRGEEDADGNPLTTIRVDELSALRDQPDALSALAELVELKDMKDQHGKVSEYCRRQPVAWGRAREILAHSPGTFACPICGKDSLHQHTGEEMAKHRGAAAPEPIHASDAPTDDAYVMDFAEVMKAKMARSREKGRDDWQDCSPDDLSRMLRDHVEKGDPVDVANFCMMLYHLGKPIATRPAPAVDAVPVHAATPNLRDDEIEEFKAVIEDFEDNGETAVDYVLLMDWARRGLLECVHFEVTNAGRDALKSAKATPDAAKGEA